MTYDIEARPTLHLDEAGEPVLFELEFPHANVPRDFELSSDLQAFVASHTTADTQMVALVGGEIDHELSETLEMVAEKSDDPLEKSISELEGTDFDSWVMSAFGSMLSAGIGGSFVIVDRNTEIPLVPASSPEERTNYLTLAVSALTELDNNMTFTKFNTQYKLVARQMEDTGQSCTYATGERSQKL